jgi:hypothetical protein
MLLEGTYAGALEAETEAVAGLVIKSGQAAAFVAGKGESLDTHSRWFKGELDPEPRRSLLEKDGWTLDLRPDGLDTVALLTDPDMASITFRLEALSDDGPQGLYSAMDEGCRLGVVIHQPTDASSPQSQGVWCSSGGSHKEVTVGDIDVEPIEVTVEVEGESRKIPITPVDPAELWALFSISPCTRPMPPGFT